MQVNIDSFTFFIVISTVIIFLLACLIISLMYLHQKRQLLYQNNLNTLKLDFEKNLLKTQVEIQEETFEHISREIHDNISLSLTLAKLNLNTLDWFEPMEADKAVKSSIQLLGVTIEELSSLSKSMNTELIRNLGLLNAVKNEVERIQNLAHLQVSYEITGDSIFMDSEKELVIFRIIQEALNNILKHAGATKVWLQLDYCEKCLDIHIRDNGRGFNKEDGEHSKKTNSAGLINMQTRAKLFKGKVMIESSPDSGTQILVTVPY